MIDKLWWEWQLSCITNSNDYGSNSLNSLLPPFSKVVSQVYSVRGHEFCYAYSSNQGDSVPFNVACPAGQLRKRRNDAADGPRQNGIQAPKGTDRTNLDKLRYPDPISIQNIKLMGLDVDKVRQAEKIARDAVDKYNNLENYTSSAALRNFNTYNTLGLWKP